MTVPLHQPAFLQRFVCKAAQCEDTCCKGWDMQMNASMREKYVHEAPELLDAVIPGEASEWIMKRDPQSDYCVKFDHGLCGVHATKGSTFLGDACHFYPRVTRRLGEQVAMTATPSCPEIVRLAILAEDGFVPDNATAARLPESLKDYLPAELSAAQAQAIHALFLQCALDETQLPEQALLRIASVARSLEVIAPAMWAAATPVYLSLAAGRIPVPETAPTDPFNLLHALCGLTVATKKRPTQRLLETVAPIEQALNTQLYWDRAAITTQDNSPALYLQVKKAWSERYAAHFHAPLRRWLALQLSVALFPFAGLGVTLTERITIIGVRFATVRLALMCACAKKNAPVDGEETVKIIQSIARILDHLGDSSFSIMAYTETGWVRETRMAGLILG